MSLGWFLKLILMLLIVSFFFLQLGDVKNVENRNI